MTNTMLANEMTAHFATARALAVGDLAVFTDYAGRAIGCRVTRIDAGMAWCKVTGLGEQRPYRNGDVITRDLCHVRRAV